MSNRLGKLLSTVVTASLVASALSVVSYRMARADDTCLAGPKATTPHGSHWYYRVEPGTKRHCWYLGEERGKPAQTAAAKSSSPAPAPARPTKTPAAAPLQPSVANARAEFVNAAAANDQAPANPSSPEDATAATAADDGAANADTPKSTVTTRWPDPAINAQPSQPATAAATTAKSTAQLLGERSEPGPAVRVVSDPPPQASSYSMPMLLGGLAGALAFAGLLGFAVVKFGSLNRLSQTRRRPESIWDTADAGHPPPWQQETDASPRPRDDALRTRRNIEAQSRDILELLSRASRGGAAT